MILCPINHEVTFIVFKAAVTSERRKTMHIDKKKLSYLEYVNRENNFVHQTFNEDALQYVYLREGNTKAVEEATRNFNPAIQGRISENDLRNIKYLFVSAVTLASRYAIEGGMDQKLAFSASDLYIRQMDLMNSTEDVVTLHKEMIQYFLSEVIANQKKKQVSLPVSKCIDYIYDHLNENIQLSDIAAYTGLHPNYLSALFRKETGETLTDFIQKEKIKTACNMLKYTEYSYSDISSTLAFSSQSYFIKVFKSIMGITPKEYRNSN